MKDGLEGLRNRRRGSRDRDLRRGHPRDLRSDRDGLSSLAILALVLFPLGLAAAWLLGTPLDPFTVSLATALFLSLTVALAFTHRGALLPMAYVLLFWFGFLVPHLL